MSKKKKPTAKKTTQKPAKKAAQNVTASHAPSPELSPEKQTERTMSKQNFQFDQLAPEALKDAANQSREGMEAFVKSGEIFAKGFESIMKATATMTQNMTEKQAEFTKQLMGSKTLNEFTEAQNKIAQTSFDQFMSGATELTEMSVKLLSEASEPINAQLSGAMQKANKAMAA